MHWKTSSIATSLHKANAPFESVPSYVVRMPGRDTNFEDFQSFLDMSTILAGHQKPTPITIDCPQATQELVAKFIGFFVDFLN